MTDTPDRINRQLRASETRRQDINAQIRDLTKEYWELHDDEGRLKQRLEEMEVTQ